MSNRTIKFRGMRKDNREWIVGDLITGGNGSSRKYILSESATAFDEYDEVIPETVGQLCQYECKEYWEGDYDEDGNMLYFCDDCQGWQFAQIDVPTKDFIFCHNCEGNFSFQEHINDFVAISNIHQQPTTNEHTQRG